MRKIVWWNGRKKKLATNEELLFLNIEQLNILNTTGRSTIIIARLIRMLIAFYFIYSSRNLFLRFLSPSLLPQDNLHSSYLNRWTVFDCQNNNNIYISHFMHLTWRFTFCNVNYDSRYHRKYKRTKRRRR